MTDPLGGRVLAADEVADEQVSWALGNRREIATTHIFGVVSDEVITPDGERMVRDYVRHPGAVAVIALDADERVVLVRQYRHPVGYRLVEPPAGILDVDGEDPWAAARRELAEEVGIAATDWRALVDVFTSPGMGNEAIRIYLARGVSAADRPEGFVAEGEEADMELVWADLDHLADAVLAGRVQNPSLCTGVLAAVAARARGYDTLRPADAPWPAKSS